MWPQTSGAVVLSYPELVEVSRISNGELVIIGVDRLLPVLHVDSQLITALSGDPLDVVETCAETTHVTFYGRCFLVCLFTLSLRETPTFMFQLLQLLPVCFLIILARELRAGRRSEAALTYMEVIALIRTRMPYIDWIFTEPGCDLTAMDFKATLKQT